MTQNSLTTIGVTGITGSGTSTVSAILAERGGFVAGADKLAHDCMNKKEPAYAEIVKAFGKEILAENGEINRRLLGTRVFGNKEELAKLESIIHPRVIERTKKLIEKLAETGEYTFMVIDAPLLIESGMITMCDSCWLATAPDEIRLARIMKRDGIDEAIAKRRLQSRKGEETLREHANIIIHNDGSAIALRSKIEMALKAMQIKKHGWPGLDVLEL